MSVGLQREDMSVIATMIDPTCLPTEFSIHRNRRALLSIFSLAPFSNNHDALVPLFDPVSQLIALQNGDEGVNALALSFLADCCNGRNEYREAICLQGGLIRGLCSCLGGSPVHGVRTFEAISAASLLRNIVAGSCPPEYMLKDLEESDAETAAVNLLATLRRSDFDDDVSAVAKGMGTDMDSSSESMLHTAFAIVCSTLSNLASLGSENRQRIIDADGVQVLLRVIRTQCNEVQAAAADALTNLAIDNSVGETLLKTRDSSILFTMATHETDIKVSKTAGACLANITSLHSIQKSRIVITGISFFQRINGADVRAIVRKRMPNPEDTKKKKKKKKHPRRRRHGTW